MELDRKLFSYIEKTLRADTKCGLNGEVEKFRAQIDGLGKTTSDFKRLNRPSVRTTVRRALQRADKLDRLPGTADVLTKLNELYAGIALVSQDQDTRQRVQIFAQYISSSAP